MKVMAKKKSPPPADQPEPSGKPRYPSRENTRYVAVPLDLYELLQKLAADKSDVDDEKSVTWAARYILRRGLQTEGYTSKPRPKQD